MTEWLPFWPVVVGVVTVVMGYAYTRRDAADAKRLASEALTLAKAATVGVEALQVAKEALAKAEEAMDLATENDKGLAVLQARQEAILNTVKDIRRNMLCDPVKLRRAVRRREPDDTN